MCSPLALFNRSLGAWPGAWLWIFQQVLDEGSMLTVGMFTGLVTGEGRNNSVAYTLFYHLLKTNQIGQIGILRQMHLFTLT